MTADRGVSARLPTAVLWDLDGTLVDTEPYWQEAEFALVERYGGTWTIEDARFLTGSHLVDSANYMRQHAGVPLAANRIVEELQTSVVAHLRREVPWREGALELLTDLRQHSMRCALVTSSYREFTDAVLARLPPDTFEVVVTGDTVTHGKPHPEPYLTALERLGVAAADTVAIEDSSPGTLSAEAAGCTVLVVPAAAIIDPAPARIFADTLSGMRASTLSRLLQDR